MYHSGDSYNGHTLLIMEPRARRAAALLINANSLVAQAGALTEIEAGVVRLLAGQEPVPVAPLSLGALYLMIDALLGGLVILALWPLVRTRRWAQRLRRQRDELGRWLWVRISLHLSWDYGALLTLLASGRLLLRGLGAQSWAEGIAFFPDFAGWLWAIALLMVLTGTIHLWLVLHMFCLRDNRQQSVAPVA
jgi:hypothetical protein